jgi:hypothetical protein
MESGAIRARPSTTAHRRQPVNSCAAFRAATSPQCIAEDTARTFRKSAECGPINRDRTLAIAATDAESVGSGGGGSLRAHDNATSAANADTAATSTRPTLICRSTLIPETATAISHHATAFTDD